MSEKQRDEKEEKQEKDQGGWEEKWRRDPIDAAMWAIILIWVGFVLLGANMGLFDDLGNVESWSVGFLGAGVIVLLAVAFRLVVPAYRRPLTGNFILGLVFIGIGLGDIVGWLVIGPIILIGIGVGALATGFLRRR